MTWLIVLAGFMAIYGVLGYLRGWRASLFVLILTLVGIAITGSLGDDIIRYVNGFGKGFRFLVSGGMGVLMGEGSAEAALQALRSAPNIVEGANGPLVLGILFVVVDVLAVLLSGLPTFKGGRSVLGLFLGLAAGYLVAAMIVRAVMPEYLALAPLPFGFAPPAATAVAPIQPGAGGPAFSARIFAFLTGLADRGLIATFLAILIAAFLLIAVRGGSHGAKKG